SAISIRFSRGRSTPERRAMRAGLLLLAEVCRRPDPRPPGRGPRPPTGGGLDSAGADPGGRRITGWWLCSALALLVAQVLADHHYATVPADDLALVADRLDARVDLHGRVSPRWCRPRGQRTGLLVAVDDAPAGQVVRRELHHDPVLGEDPDVVLAHLAADVGENPVSVGQFDPEHRVGKRLDDATLDLDGSVLLRHILR